MSIRKTPGQSRKAGFPALTLALSLPLWPLAQAGAQFTWPEEGTGALKTLHPDFTVTNLRPDGYAPKITGMAWLSGNRLAISTWLDYEVHILEGVTGNDRTKVTYTKFATGLDRPQGLTAVGDTLYMIDRTNVRRLTDNNHDGKAEITALTTAYAQDRNHPFAYGLLHRDGYLYFGFGGYSGPKNGRGNAYRMDLSGKREILASGLRNPNGFAFGPDGELFVTDNQGEWLPSNKLIHVQKDRFYGYRSASTPAEAVESPPAVHLPWGEETRSPSQPIYVTSQKGWERYAGQMIIGDMRLGNLVRVNLEKVKGEYQGAAFRFTGGLEAGINRMLWGPDDALYLGGVGDPSSSGWNWNNKLSALQRLAPKSDSVFEMLAIRARKGGFEIEFTEPLGAAAESTGNYYVRTWRYEPTEKYGGPDIEATDLTVDKVRLSPDRKKAWIEVAGLKENRVVYIRIHPDIKSAADRKPPSGEAWYTLNAFSDQAFPASSGQAYRDGSGSSAGLSGISGLVLRGDGGSRPELAWAGQGGYSLEIRDIRGETLVRRSGQGAGRHSLAKAGFSPGLYVAVLKTGTGRFSRRILVGKAP